MSNYSQKPTESRLTELFLCETPLKDIQCIDSVDITNIPKQRDLLHSTVLHDVCQKFPPSVEYVRKFLKKIIHRLESSSAEVCEDVYNLYVANLERKSSSYSYKSYHLPTVNQFIPLLECSSFLSSGTTGLNTWMGAKLLADWCICNKDLFTGKRVIELGAGVGFTGIMLTKSCSPLSYVFTDYHEKVLKILNYNVKVNFDESAVVYDDDNIVVEDPLSLPSKYHSGSSDISIEAIDWMDQCGTNKVLGNYDCFDVVLAADVVFEPSLLSFLVNTLFSILYRSYQSKSQCVAYFSIAVRNEDTFAKFCHELRSKSLEFKELEMNFPCKFHTDMNFDVKLLQITFPPAISFENEDFIAVG